MKHYNLNGIEIPTFPPKFKLGQQVACNLPYDGAFKERECLVRAYHMHVWIDAPMFWSYDLISEINGRWVEFSGIREDNIRQ